MKILKLSSLKSGSLPHFSIIIFLMLFFCGIFSCPARAQSASDLNSLGYTYVHLQPSMISSREDRCLKAGRVIGVVAGSTMGLFHIYWRARGVSGIHGPFWKSVVIGIPSSMLGAYVGMKTTEWTTRQIMKGKPKPLKAALKGAFYGAIDGAIILTVSFIPLFILGHYLDVIHFNDLAPPIVLRLIGISVVGGSLYGGVIGAGIGVVYGPCISLYMNF